MNKLKIILLLTIILWFICGIDFYACDEVEDDDLAKVRIKKPTNDYQVEVQLYSFGGMQGCTIASVEKAGEVIGDAEIILNEVEIADKDTLMESIVYFDTSGVISYLPGTKYELQVRHNEQTIATGNIIMPSSPIITNLTFPYNHQLNQSLTIQWKKVQDATAINLLLYGVNSEGEIDTILAPQRTSFTIPDTFFNKPDEFILDIIAINGANSDVFSGKYEDDDGNFTQSINLSGASGIFYAMNYQANDKFSIIVNGEESVGKPSNVTPHKMDLRKILKNRHRKKLSRFNF